MGQLTGERRALASALLAMYGFLYLLLSVQAPEGWGTAFGGLSMLYGVGFVGLVAGYFWARWFVIGLGLSGFVTGAMSIVQLGTLEPALVFYASTHLAVTGLLWGNGMARNFDGRPEWRKRFHLDEGATNKLGKAIIRVGMSLPYILLFALAPREDAMLAIVGGGTVIAGVWGLTQLRSWALPVLAGGAATMLYSAMDIPCAIPLYGNYAINLPLVAVGAIGLTMLALAPFVGPVFNFLRSSDSTQ